MNAKKGKTESKKTENIFEMFAYLNDAYSYSASARNSPIKYARIYLKYAKQYYKSAQKQWEKAGKPKGFTKYFKYVLNKMTKLENELRKYE